MATYQDIQNVNNQMMRTPIHGKNYAEVPQRVQAFRCLYPEGYILTEMVSNDGGVCVMRATVGYYRDNEPVTLATGTAYEKEGSTNINRTSYIENCETSAVGRALGMLGLGSETSICSAEEVATAIMQQKKLDTVKETEQINDKIEPDPADEQKIERRKGVIEKLMAVHGLGITEFNAMYGSYCKAVLKSPDTILLGKLSDKQFDDMILAINERLNKGAA